MSEGSQEEVTLAGDQGTMRPWSKDEPLIVALLTIRTADATKQTYEMAEFVAHAVVWGAEMELRGIVHDLKGSAFQAEWEPVSLERPDEIRARLGWVFED